MFSNQPSKKITGIVVSHLFQGDNARLREWVSIARARAEECAQSVGSTPQLMSSNVLDIDHEQISRLCATIDRTGFAHYAWQDEPTDPLASLNLLLQRLGLTKADKGIIRDRGELSLLSCVSSNGDELAHRWLL